MTGRPVKQPGGGKPDGYTPRRIPRPSAHLFGACVATRVNFSRNRRCCRVKLELLRRGRAVLRVRTTLRLWQRCTLSTSNLDCGFAEWVYLIVRRFSRCKRSREGTSLGTAYFIPHRSLGASTKRCSHLKPRRHPFSFYHFSTSSRASYHFDSS
jgi:hypothetical protein